MYVLRIVEEPDEDGIMLTQADFDQLVTLGKTASVDQPDEAIQAGDATGEEVAPEGASANMVPFATLETIDPAGTFIYLGQTIDEETAGTFCERGLTAALRSALADAASA